MDEDLENSQCVDDQVDFEKLVSCVKARPELYNFNLKHHYNNECINGIWKDISKEMNLPGSVCRNKWHNIRCSYTRYLRGLKSGPPKRNGIKRKKWFLADAMDFLREYVNCSKKNKPNNSAFEDVDEQSPNISSVFGQVVEAEVEVVSPTYENDPVRYIVMESNELAHSEIKQKLKLKRRSETVNESVENKVKLQEDDTMLYFFKSCVGDVSRLSAKRQRAFKSGVIQLLNNLMDEQEEVEAVRTTGSSLLQ